MPRKPKSSSESTALAEAPSPGAAPARDAHASKPTGRRIFLIDAMSFIFRAYHAMARQRPMSTRTGVPTDATYVFTNMLNKLRDDFHPEYLAAVFDVAGPTFRDTQGAAVSEIRKWDIRTQQFQNVAYGGYKANRAEMPPDLAQQVPYIRRALAAFRIPILENPGYEADDVIGTLARQGAEQGREVFVVSSDKDMLQLVNEHVCVLNPPKDNLICDRAKVEEILGVPPERVIDVMALRGDTIDNIPGAPGIGDKGSVELIRRFGSVEAALEHASEVEKKTYRESLLNNREQILYSKDQVTIDCHVPGVTLDAALLETMAAQEPDIEACRELFTELEFTTLLKTIAPVTDVQEKNYLENAGREEVRELLAHASRQARLALAIDMAVAVPSPSRGAEGEDDHDEHAGGSESNLFSEANAPAAPAAQMIALSTKAGQALTASIDSPEIRQALESPSLPKAVHDSKAAMRSLSPVEFASTGAAPAPRLRGVVHDTALYSYLLDPTYSSHSLADVALRRFNLQLSGGLAEAADMTGRLAKALSEEVDREDLRTVYEEIDLPLVPVLERMEAAGVKIDCDVLKQMSARLERECDAKAREIYQRSAVEFNINSPKQLGEVLFEKLGLRKPVKYGKGKTVSTAAEVLQDLAEEHQVPRLVLQYRELSKLKSTYVDA
ncbi:MAG TPA: DNA polymerase, partial [Terriglobales bacterium]|nr:DNA polymerase [Terriglobales bacterium]